MKTMTPKIKEHTCTACNGTGFASGKRRKVAVPGIERDQLIRKARTLRQPRTCKNGLRPLACARPIEH